MIGARLGFMSPAVTYDTDAQTYITAVETADGQSLETSVRTAINNFVVGCKADGIWSALKTGCIMMGARTLGGAITPLVGSAPTNNNFLSGDYDRKLGLKGNGSTKWLNANRAGNADPQTDQHFSACVSAASTNAAVNAMIIGAATTDLLQVNSGGTFRSRGISTAGIDTRNSATFFGVARTASTAWTYRWGGTTFTGPTSAAGGSTASGFGVFARNNAGTPQFYFDGRLSFYSIGTSLTLATLNSRVSTLSAAIAAAIP